MEGAFGLRRDALPRLQIEGARGQATSRPAPAPFSDGDPSGDRTRPGIDARLSISASLHSREGGTVSGLSPLEVTVLVGRTAGLVGPGCQLRWPELVCPDRAVGNEGL